VAADIATVSVLTSVLAQSVPLIKDAIADSLRLKKNEIEVAVEADQLQNVVREKIIEQAQEGRIAQSVDVKADTLMSDWIVQTRNSLAAQRQESLSEVKITFIVTLSALIIGILLVFTGLILVFTTGLKIGIVTTSSSIVTGIVGGLAFKFNQQAHERLEKIDKEKEYLDFAYAATIIADKIADQDKRDSTIEELVRKFFPGKLD
jgi:hypothetical protein